MKNEDAIYHRSGEFWQRLHTLFSLSSHTQQSLAAEVGVDRKTISRLLHRGHHTEFVKLIYDVAQALEVSPDVLFNGGIDIPGQNLTGIHTIDIMLNHCYNETSETGTNNFGKYVSTNYRLTNKNAGQWIQSNPLRKHGTQDYIGITYESELDHNQKFADTNGTNRTVTLQRAYIEDEKIVVFYHWQQKRLATQHNEERTLDVRRALDHLTLEKSIETHANDNRLKPKIKRRAWTEIKMLRRGEVLQ
jgi:transcriptional regulator with XRE-family HTH domain